MISFLSSKDAKDRLKKLAQKHLTAERMLTLAVECVHKTPKLAECEHLSVLGAFLTAHSLGLEPNTPLGHAYLIPYQGWYKDENGNWQQKQATCNFMIGYKGFSQLFWRTGKIKTFAAEAIREGDNFEHVIGTETRVSFTKALSKRGEILGSFCHINKSDDGQQFEIVEKEELEKIRLTSETYKNLKKAVEEAERKNDQREIKQATERLNETPWVKWSDGMVAKSAIKRLSKVSDLDPRISMAAEIDSLSDIGKADFSKIVDAKDTDEVFSAFSSQHSQATIEDQRSMQKPVNETVSVNLDDIKVTEPDENTKQHVSSTQSNSKATVENQSNQQNFGGF
jgi:recombination protein RecT